MLLVVGLGNPGTQYDGTRHNVGFEALDLVASRFGFPPFKQWKKSEISRGRISQVDVLLVKPQTFMNLSGDAVGPIARYYRCEPSDVVVVHDELDFDVGKCKLKVGGGHGGHNGLRSIMDHIGRDFARIRVGIGKPTHGRGADYVLSRFDASSRVLVDEVLEDIADAIEGVASKGVRAIMNKFNSREKSASQGDPKCL